MANEINSQTEQNISKLHITAVSEADQDKTKADSKEIIEKHFSVIDKYILPSIEEFQDFKSLCCSTNGFALIDENKNLSYKAYVMSGKGSLTVNKSEVVIKDVESEELYEMLLDSEYRKKWDKNMLERFTLHKITEYSEIYVYYLNLPVISCRYTIASRNFHKLNDGEYVIYTHSVTDPKNMTEIFAENESKIDLKKDVRVSNYVSGYYIRKNSENELVLTNISCTDLKLAWGMDNLAQKLYKSKMPKNIESIIKCAKKYKEWKKRKSENVVEHKESLQKFPISCESEEYKNLSNTILKEYYE